MNPLQFKFLSILGKPGSGKGTQADLLEQKFPFEHISTGELLRVRTKQHDFIAKRLREIMEIGGLVPTPSVFQLWMPRLEHLRRQKKFQGVVFDGSPRKLYEAQMLDELLLLYQWDKNFKILHLVISDKEALKRLLIRGRSDDDRKDTLYRLKVYKKEVLPVISYYEKQGEVIEINGEQSRDDVHKEIMRKLKSFLK
ncbi:MAG: nucleoside monophosphate kinase [bacterium]|nr:nucleoside monophosphate kinase [bacterium]